MGPLGYLFCALCIHGATAATISKAPAFATPVYSDAYLPAAMQVIFNIVDQLKRMEAEEAEQNILSTSATSPHPPGMKQPLPTTPSAGTTAQIETSTVSDEEKYYVPPEQYQEEALIISKPAGVDVEKLSVGQVTPEVNHEESEIVYGVPETSFELPETNQEEPEEGSHVDSSQLETPSGIASKPGGACAEFKTSSTVDSVIKEIYSIVQTSSSNAENVSSEAPAKNRDECIEGKNSPGNVPAVGAEEELPENKERSDELKDDKRFTLLGERVDQVPRPSLVAMLRASNGTSSPSLRQLGEVYDALSRDARRQGFSKFAGYSNAVLKSLVDSAGGGAGLQLKELLEKTVEQKELTRYDSMVKTKEIISVLKDDGSKLSTDLRRLLPLRYMA